MFVRMPMFYVFLNLRRGPGLHYQALIRLLHAAAERSVCVPIEVTPLGMVIEAEPRSLQTFEETIHELLRERGSDVERFTVTQILT